MIAMPDDEYDPHGFFDGPDDSNPWGYLFIIIGCMALGAALIFGLFR